MSAKVEQSQKNSIDIARLEGKIDVLSERVSTIMNNHLKHIQQDIDRNNKFMWIIGTIVFTQMCFLIVRTLI